MMEVMLDDRLKNPRRGAHPTAVARFLTYCKEVRTVAL